MAVTFFDHSVPSRSVASYVGAPIARPSLETRILCVAIVLADFFALVGPFAMERRFGAVLCAGAAVAAGLSFARNVRSLPILFAFALLVMSAFLRLFGEPNAVWLSFAGLLTIGLGGAFVASDQTRDLMTDSAPAEALVPTIEVVA